MFKTLFFLGAIQRCEYEQLGLLKNKKSILVIGGGTGKIIHQIEARCEFDVLAYVDSSKKMIASAQAHISRAHPELLDKVEFYTEDIQTFVPSRTYDAVLTPFVLDCFTEEQLLDLGPKTLSWLSSDGIWLFSDFSTSSNSGVSRVFSLVMTTFLYLVFKLIANLKIVSLPDFENFFKQLPLKLIEERTFFLGVLSCKAYRKISSNS
ncbi:MAG: class I SAM-dependent methyltransferase [Flavobacteriales bacterium]|nr:class I SAM-dependent methyltransferase [Flavobacteriales bacterium]